MRIISDTIIELHIDISILYQLFFYANSTIPSQNAILYPQAISLLSQPVKFQKRIFYAENYHLYDLTRRFWKFYSRFSSEKWFFQTYIDDYEACGACNPAERGAGFWQDGSARGGCSSDPCSGRDQCIWWRNRFLYHSSAVTSGYPV